MSQSCSLLNFGVISCQFQFQFPRCTAGNNAAKLPQILAAIGACFGAFCLGNGFGWSSPTFPAIVCDAEAITGDCGCDYCFDGDQSGWISGFFALGAFFSSFVTGVSLSTVGRRCAVGVGLRCCHSIFRTLHCQPIFTTMLTLPSS